MELWLWFLWSMLPLSLRLYKVYHGLHFWFSPVLQLGSWAWLCVKGVTAACETTLVSQWSYHKLWASFWNYPGSEMHVMRNSCFPSNKYRVFLEYICRSVTHNLTLRPNWHRALVEAVIHLDFPFSIFLCGGSSYVDLLPSHHTMQEDHNKKQ